MNETDCFYYVDAHKAVAGPLAYEDLLLLQTVGQIDPSTPVARHGDRHWISWGRISKNQDAGPDFAEDQTLPPVPGQAPESPFDLPTLLPMQSKAAAGESPRLKPSGSESEDVSFRISLPKPGGGQFHTSGFKDETHFPLPPPPSTETTTPSPVAAPVSRFWKFAAFALLPLFFLAALIYFELHHVSISSLANDEIQSPEKLARDYTEWRSTYLTFVQHGPQAWKKLSSTIPQQKISWWHRSFQMPPEPSVRAALERRFSPNMELDAVQGWRSQRSDDGVAAIYSVRMHFRSAAYLVPVEEIPWPRPELAKYQHFTQYLIVSDDLPPGKHFDIDDKKPVARTNVEIQFFWKIRRAIVDKGMWKIVDAEPLPMERNALYEQMLLGYRKSLGKDAGELEKSPVPIEGRSIFLLRSQEELDASRKSEDQAMQDLISRLTLITQDVEDYRKQLTTELPPLPKKPAFWRGRNGDSGFEALTQWFDSLSKSDKERREEAIQLRTYQKRMNGYESARKKMEESIAKRESDLLAVLEEDLKSRMREKENHILATGP